MKNKNIYFVHNDGRNDYDVLVKDEGSAWVLKEEYFEFNGEVKPQNKIELANEKKYQDLFDEFEEKCLSGKLTSIAREIDL
tara:strand:- start:234 stop:476 length:243 start_codon:yes stop_codon:yes gene_type:complete